MNSSVTPVISGFFPDPTICRVGEDFYLATSSFEYFPGAPIFRSRDLLQWEQIGNILTRRTQFALGDGRASGGIFGSTLRHHDGEFWFVTTNMSDFGGGHLLFRAEDPAGPWSEPQQIAGTLGIDPDIAWDRDGTCYLTWVGFGPGEDASGIVQARLDPSTGELLESPRKLWQGSGLAYPEGPHLYSADGWWYLMLAEGGTDRGHVVSVSRGTSPSGPFEPCPRNPVFTHRSLDTPVHNAGHADLVEGADGTWAAVYLAVRSRGSTPGYHVLGRETFLAGITWEDGWPRFDDDRYPVPTADTSFTDDFTSPELHPRWISPGDEPASFTGPAGPGSPGVPGGLVLTANGQEESPLLATRIRDEAWTGTATVSSVEGTAGLILRIDESHWYAVRIDGEIVRALARIGPLEQEVATAQRRGAGPLQLEISAFPSAEQPGVNSGPDDVVLGFREAGQFRELARLDGRYLSTEVAGGFTGRVIGVSAGGGRTVLERFEYRPTDHGTPR
ncbi:glycoside hydrolase family 43 protein [Arthrobacter sedimenti]|uniref:glycoside hydrolase family 43 protein n=1 Tax=Arthrobacter sedimenti TaxID=2694931 RepID=UPI000B34EEDC|nr:glycoside hydrolase family 43 protein [Arthrobacter sedimenti]OUM44870.1 glycoside hydrolase 43 family protein [Arthrobacter agilis]